MGRAHVFTRLNVLADMTKDDEDVKRMMTLPHYVISQQLMKIMGREDVQKSIKAMVVAGVAKLPFPKMMIEFGSFGALTRFVELEENDNKFIAKTVILRKDETAAFAHERIVELSAEGLAVKSGHPAGQTHLADTYACLLAISFALLLLNTRGVEKEVIEPSQKLNRALARAGKTLVGRHTVLRIGTIYNREGGRVTSRRGMPVHFRAGHAREQAYGPQMSLRKTIYIPPTLVNFTDGSSIPEVKKLVTV